MNEGMSGVHRCTVLCALNLLKSLLDLCTCYLFDFHLSRTPHPVHQQIVLVLPTESTGIQPLLMSPTAATQTEPPASHLDDIGGIGPGLPVSPDLLQPMLHTVSKGISPALCPLPPLVSHLIQIKS